MSKPDQPVIVKLRRRLLQLEIKLNKIEQIKHPLIWDIIERRLLLLQVADTRKKIQEEIINLS